MKTTLYSLFLLLLWNCSTDKPLPTAGVYKTVSPVFIGKNENVLLHLVIDNLSPEEITVDEIRLKDAGTSNLTAISCMQLFFTGTSEEFSSRVLFGRSQQADRTVKFTGCQTLRPGKNHFWASVTLSPSARLSDRIHFTCSEIKTGSGRVRPNAASPFLPSTVGYCIRKKGDDGVNTYRIPGLTYTSRGTLIAVYDIRHNNAYDLQEDIDVGISRSADKGQTWLPMQRAIDMGRWGGLSEKENGAGDPAVLSDPQTGRIWIAALWLHGHSGKRAWWASGPGLSPEQTGQLVLVYSDDEGATWSEPVSITPQIKKPEWHLCFNGPGMGITTKDGVLVFAAQFKDKDQVPHSTVLYSKDKGQSWQIGTSARSHTTEAQVAELSDGSLMLNMRDDRGGSRAIAVTRDFGKTWTEHPSSRSALPEPVCQASLLRIRLEGGKQALAFFNPADTADRVRSTLKLSFDEGLTWPEKYHTLIYEPGSYGYSCLTQLDSTTLGVLYEGAGELYYQQINLREILLDEEPGSPEKLVPAVSGETTENL